MQPKGAPLHRKSGMFFVSVMLTMSVTGMLMAAVRGVAPAINIPTAALTAYLVVTALTTVRPPAAGSRWLDIGAMLVALAVGLTCLAFGFEAAASTSRRENGMAYPFFMFGFVGLLAGAGDLRVVRSGPLEGAPRLARHLWRMCFALFIASLSFFVGQEKVFPCAAPHPRSPCASNAGGARGDVLLAVARPRQTDLSRCRWRQRT